MRAHNNSRRGRLSGGESAASGRDANHAPALKKKTFWALCIYLIVLFLSSVLALLGSGTTAGKFVAFEEIYILTIIIQAAFGIFVLPLLLQISDRSREALAEYITLHSAALPFVVVAAFSAGVAWHTAVLTQVLVFAIWSLASVSYGLFAQRRRCGKVYLPLWSFLFFGLLVAGEVLESSADGGAVISTLSVAGILASWSSRQFLNISSWLAVATCLTALVIWWRKFLLESKQ